MSDRQPIAVYYGMMGEGGKPLLDDAESFIGKPIAIYLYERPASDELTPLRNFLHGVVLPEICRASGCDTTDAYIGLVKQGLKERFLTIPAAPGDPKVVRSTESLSVSEYAWFVNCCIRYSAEELHHEIRDPRKVK